MLLHMAEYPSFLLALPLNLHGQLHWFRLYKIFLTEIPLHFHIPCCTHWILHCCSRDQILAKYIYLRAPHLFMKNKNLNPCACHIKPHMINLLYSLSYCNPSQARSYRAALIFLKKIRVFAWPPHVCTVSPSIWMASLLLSQPSLASQTSTYPSQLSLKVLAVSSI